MDLVASAAHAGATSGAAIVVVFASFVLSTDPTVKMLAIGMAFAVLIDASLVRMILVPSIMALLDARAWWMPRWLEPIVPHLQLEGSTAPASPAAPAAPAPAGRPRPRPRPRRRRRRRPRPGRAVGRPQNKAERARLFPLGK
jgi:RND superfamily putative drug exporter